MPYDNDETDKTNTDSDYRPEFIIGYGMIAIVALAFILSYFGMLAP